MTYLSQSLVLGRYIVRLGHRVDIFMGRSPRYQSDEEENRMCYTQSHSFSSATQVVRLLPSLSTSPG